MGARFGIALAFAAACGVTVKPDWPPPKLPATPMRIAIAPVAFDPSYYGTTIPPNVRGDLVDWLDEWHGLRVVASATVDESKPLPMKINVFKMDVARVRALCQAARADGVDAIVYAQYIYMTYDPGSCNGWANEWSTSGNTGKCTDWEPSGRTEQSTYLYVRALYPARCVFGKELDLT